MANRDGTKSGGRRKGTPNKNTCPAQERAEQLGVDPIEILLLVVKGDWAALGYKNPLTITLDQRINAAKEVAQYIVPKKRSVELSGELDTAPKEGLTPEEARTELQGDPLIKLGSKVNSHS